MYVIWSGPRSSTRHIEVLRWADVVNWLVNILDWCHWCLLTHDIVWVKIFFCVFIYLRQWLVDHAVVKWQRCLFSIRAFLINHFSIELYGFSCDVFVGSKVHLLSTVLVLLSPSLVKLCCLVHHLLKSALLLRRYGLAPFVLKLFEPLSVRWWLVNYLIHAFLRLTYLWNFLRITQRVA